MRTINEIVSQILNKWQEWIITAALILFVFVIWIVEGGITWAAFATLWLSMIGVAVYFIVKTVDIVLKKEKVSLWYLGAAISSAAYLGYLYLNVHNKYIVSYLIFCIGFAVVFIGVGMFKNMRANR